MQAKRLLALLLAIVMIVGIMPVSAFASETEGGTDVEVPSEEVPVETTPPVEEPAPDENGYKILTEESPVLVELSPDVTMVYISFTPSVTHTYTICSEIYNGNRWDTFGYLYDSNMNLLTSNDDGAGDTQFLITYNMTAGQTYIIGATLYSAGSEATYTVSVATSHSHELEYEVEATCTTDGLRTWTCPCGDTYTEVIPASHIFVDGVCSACSEIETYSGTCGENLSWHVDYSTGLLTISGIGVMAELYSEGFPWADYSYGITKIVVEDGVTSIAHGAFMYMGGVEEVQLPESVTAIGSGAFYYLEKLSTINIPSGVTVIENNTFYHCSALTAIDLPEGVTSIGDYAFYSCGLTEIEIPAAVTRLGQYSFQSSKLTKITLHEGLQTIDKYALYATNALEVLDLPSTVTSIGYRALMNSGVKHVIFRGDLPSIDIKAFTYTEFTAHYPADNESWGDPSFNYGGTVTWKPYSGLIILEEPVAQPSVSGSTVTITVDAYDEDVTYAWYTAPAGSDTFTLDETQTGSTYTVVLTEDTVGQQIYCVVSDGTNSVTSNTVTLATWPTLSEGVTSDVSITTGGEYVEFVFVPEYTCDYWFTSEGDYDTVAFLYDADRNQLSSDDDGGTDTNFGILRWLEAGKTYILRVGMLIDSQTGDFTVSVSLDHQGYQWEIIQEATCTTPGLRQCVCDQCGLTWTEEYTITHSYTEGACDYCGEALNVGGTFAENLSWSLVGTVLTISGSGDMESYLYWDGAPWFEYRYHIKTIQISDEITSIGDYAFSGLEVMTDVTIPASVISIGSSAFYQCLALESIVVPDSVQNMGRSVFSQCPNLRSVTLPAGLTAITDYMFQSCFALTDVNIPETVNYIGTRAFMSCNALQSITVPDGVITLGEYAFYECSSLNSIVLPEGITNIPYSCFAYCSNLKTVTIPDSVTMISSYAFESCASLSSVVIPANVTNLYYNCFAYCDSLKVVVFKGDIPTYVDGEAFYHYRGSVTYYYPADNTTYTDTVLASGYGASSYSWVSYSGLVIYSQPQDANAFDGETATVSVGAAGTDLCYAWYVAAPGSDEFQLDVTQTGSSYCVTMSSDVDGSRVYCVITDEDGNTVTTNTVTISTPNFIEEGVETTVTISEPGKIVTVYLTASHTCYYTFAFNAQSSANVVVRTSTDIYGNWIELMLDTGIYLTAGETYIFELTFEDAAATGDVTLLVDPHRSNWSSLVTDPTCTENGEYIYHCHNCGESWSEIVPPQHNYDDGACVDCGVSLEVSGQCGADVYWSLGSDCVLRIYGTGDMYDYSGTDQIPWLDYPGSIHSIVIESGVTSISVGAFWSCYDAETVSIPDTVTSIGSSAFYCCSNLTEVVIPDSVITMGDSVFYECLNLERVVLPAGLTEIPGNTFRYCYKLAEVVIPETVTEIGTNAFRNCESLKSIIIPAAVTAIYTRAFGSCYELQTVLFEGDAPSFSSNVFSSSEVTCYYPADNTTWTTDVMKHYSGTVTWIAYDGIVILAQPEGVMGFAGEEVSISVSAFGDNLSYAWYVALAGGEFVLDETQTGSTYTTVYTDELNGAQVYCVITSGDISVQTETALIEGVNILEPGVETEYVISEADGSVIVYFYPQFDCWYSITLAASDDYYVRLYEGSLDNKDRNNWYDSYCDSTIWLNAGQTYIFLLEFDHSETTGGIKLTMAPHRDYGYNIHSWPTCTEEGTATAYCYNCGHEWDMVLPPEHYYVDGYCEICGDMLDVSGTYGYGIQWHLSGEDCTLYVSGSGEIPSDSEAPWHEYSESIHTVVVEDGITSIGDYAFYQLDNMTSISIADSVTYIGSCAFHSCYGLESVQLPANLQQLGTNVFVFCRNLQSFSISEQNTTYCVIDGVLYDKNVNLLMLVPSGMADVTIPETVYRIERGAFYGNNAITTIHIPASVEEIGGQAFYECANLQTVTGCEGLLNIYDWAFYDCMALESIPLREGLAFIDERAFYDCDSLKSITIPSTVQTIGYQVFGDCDGLESVTISQGISAIQDYAFAGCDSLRSVIIPAGMNVIGYYAFSQCSSLQAVLFAGDPMDVGYDMFYDDTLTVYYPAGSTFWTLENKAICGGNVTWVEYEGTVLLAHPTDISAFNGDMVTLHVDAYGIGLSYTWYVQLPGGEPTAIIDPFGSSYTFTMSDEMDGAQIYCVITDANGNTVQSNTATVSAALLLEENVAMDIEITQPGQTVTVTFLPTNTCLYGFSIDAYQNVDIRVMWDGGISHFADYGYTFNMRFGDAESVTIEVGLNDSNATGTVTLKMMSHNDHWEYERQYPTCTEEGYVIYQCYECGTQQTEVLPMAHQYESGYCAYCNLELEAIGTCGDNLQWSLDGSTQTLAITGTGDMYDYLYTAAPWRQYNNGSNIRSIVVEEGVTSIGDCGFGYLHTVSSVSLPDTLVSIGNDAFYNCVQLTTVNIPASVTSIASGAFDASWKMMEINVDEDNECYASVDGALYSKDMNVLWRVPCGKETLVVPDGVTTIAERAAHSCGYLTSVTLPSSVRTIGDLAFYGCDGLETVVLPWGLTHIGYGVFMYCENLKYIVIPENVSYLGDNLFSGCSNLETVLFLCEPETVGYDIFNGCSATAYYPAGSTVWTEDVRNNCSGNITWIENTGIIVLKQPADISVMNGQTAEVSVEVYGTGLSYAWYVAAPGSEEFIQSDVTGAVYSFTMSDELSGTRVYCVITDGAGNTVTTSTATISKPVILEEGVMTTLEATQPGQVVTFYFTADHDCRYRFNFEAGYPASVSFSGVDADYFWGSNSISYSFWLTAGQTYTVEVSFFDGYTGSFDVMLDGHTSYYDEITQSATCTEEGLRTYYCYDCNHSWTEAIPAAHNYTNGYCTGCGLELTASGICGDNLQWSIDGSEQTLTITGTGNMYDYQWGEAPWYEYRQSIQHVVIGEGAASIGNYAFYYMHRLEQVTLPDSLVTIGYCAFQTCYNLSSFTIPAGVTFVPANAFIYCSWIEEFIVDKANTTYTAYDGCLYTKDMKTLVAVPARAMELVIPDGVETIGDGAANGCHLLTSLTIPDSVTYIGDEAFSNCSSLETVVIPASVTSLGDYAFAWCDSLETVLFLGDIEEVAYGYFESNTLTAYYPAGSETWTEDVRNQSYGDVNWVVNEGVVIMSQPSHIMGVIGTTISTTVETVGENLTYAWYLAAPGSEEFVLVEGQTGSTFSAEFTEAMDGAQLYCVVSNGIVSINSETVSIISVEALTEGETQVTITEPGEYITYAFVPGMSCRYYFESFGDYDTVAAIYDEDMNFIESSDDANGTMNFYLYRTLEAGKTYYLRIYMRETVNSDGTGTFTMTVTQRHSESWETVKEATCTEDGAYIVYCYYCGEVLDSGIIQARHDFDEDGICYVCGEELNESGQCGDNLYWSLGADGVLRIYGTGDMYDYSGTDQIPWLGYNRFITTIELSEGVTSIGNYAFFACYVLESITIPSTVKSIGDYAFVECHGLESIVVPEGVENLGDLVFAMCSDLTSVSLPASLTSIGWNPFTYSQALSEITIDEDNTAYCVYDGCVYTKDMTTLVAVPYSVTELVIPNTVTTIAGYAFYGSTLNVIELPDSLTTIADYAFAYCQNVESIVIPAGVTSIGNGAFGGCYMLETVLFLGNAPTIGKEAFYDNTTVCYYPTDDATWTEEVMQQYEGGEITWMPFTASIILNQPVNMSGMAGQTVSTSVNVYGEGLTYQWYIAAPGGEFVLDESQTGSTYTVVIGDETDGLQIYCVITDSMGVELTSETVTVTMIPTITLDTETQVTIENPGEKDYFVFVPEISGTYVFECMTYDIGTDPFSELYDANMNLLMSNDDGNYSLAFLLSCELKAGETYILAARFLSDRSTGSMTVKLTCVDADEDDPCADGHSYGEWYTVTEATCTEEGLEQRDCANCDHSETRAVEATGHSYGEWYTVTEATCTEEGLEQRDCANCDHSETRDVEATGHSYGEWYAVSDTEERRDCENCDHYETRTVEKPSPVIATQPSDLSVYEGASVSFSVSAEGEGLTYQWYLKYPDGEWSAWSGRTTAVTKAFTSSSKHDGLQVYCVITDANGNTVTSDVATLVVKSNPFTDLPSGKYYYEPVLWAVDSGITSGKTEDTFAPDANCTRAQVVVFLWRAAGRPEPTTTSHPFTDLNYSTTSDFYKAILWAVEMGITTGKTATTFAPDATVTREQFVVFLWRYMGKPEAKNTTNPFTDLTRGPNTDFYKAIMWAVEEGITTGKTETTFAPSESCTRGQVVTFLYRALADEE